MLTIQCSAHCHLRLNKEKGSHDLKTKMKADLDAAATDTASVEGTDISVQLMLAKWRGRYQATEQAEAILTYLDSVGGLCPRVMANHCHDWGCPNHNNASK